MAATRSIYDHASSAKYRRAEPPKPAADKLTLTEHQRNSIYDDPTSKRHRADLKAARISPEADPLGKLRAGQRDQTVALQQKHRGDLNGLIDKHRAARRADRSISNGGKVPTEWTMQEDAERRRMEARHATERSKLVDRQKHETATAINQHKRGAR